MMGPMHNQGSMQGMQSNPGMMKNLGGFNQMNMQNSPMMNGMNNPLNIMANQSFNQMGGPQNMNPPSPASMMQPNGMSSPSMNAGPGLNAGMNMQRMMASYNQMQEELNQQGEGEMQMHEPGAATPTETAFDPSMFNQQRFQHPASSGFNQMGAMGSTPPPQQQQPSNFSFSNYQPVMKQVHSPDGSTPNYNATPPMQDGHATPTFSPQNQSFNFPQINNFQNAGFNQNQTPRSPGGPYPAPAPFVFPQSPAPGGTPGSTPTNGAGMNQNMWTPMSAATTPTGGFSNPMSQFVQHNGSPGNRGFNKVNPHQFNRNYGMNNYSSY